MLPKGFLCLFIVLIVHTHGLRKTDHVGAMLQEPVSEPTPEASMMPPPRSTWSDLEPKIRNRNLTSGEKQFLLSMCEAPLRGKPWQQVSPVDSFFVYQDRSNFSAYRTSVRCNIFWNILFEHGLMWPKVTAEQEHIRIMFISACLLTPLVVMLACWTRAARSNDRETAEQSRASDVTTPLIGNDVSSASADTDFSSPPGHTLGMRAFGMMMLGLYYFNSDFFMLPIGSTYSPFNDPGPKRMWASRGLTWASVLLCIIGYEVGIETRKQSLDSRSSIRSFYSKQFWKLEPTYHIAWLLHIVFLSDIMRSEVKSSNNFWKHVVNALFLAPWHDTLGWMFDPFGTSINMEKFVKAGEDSVFGWWITYFLSPERQGFWEIWGTLFTFGMIYSMVAFFYVVTPLFLLLFRRCKGMCMPYVPVLFSYYHSVWPQILAYSWYLGGHRLFSWDLIQMNPIFRLGDFLLGFSTAHLVSEHRACGMNNVPPWFADVCFSAFLLCLMYVPEASHPHHEFGPFMVFGGLNVFIAGTLYGIEMAEAGSSMTKRFFSWRPLSALGKYQYTAYVIAHPVSWLVCAIFYGIPTVTYISPELEGPALALFYFMWWGSAITLEEFVANPIRRFCTSAHKPKKEYSAS